MIKRILITAVGLAAATFIIPNIKLSSGFTWQGFLTLLGVAIIFGVINAVVKPLFKALTGCLITLTFGLFLVVINAVLMLLTSWACVKLGLGWHIQSGPWTDMLLTAIEGSIIVSIVSFLASKLLRDRRPAREER